MKRRRYRSDFTPSKMRRRAWLAAAAILVAAARSEK